MLRTLAALCGALVVAAASPAVAGVRGDYVEARTNDVFTGPCFSNAEVFITGHQAVLAWRINEGSYKGVDLKGLTVAAAILGTSTFGEDAPKNAKAIVMVDEEATKEQRGALVALAKSLCGERLNNVVEVKTVKMALSVESHEMSPGETMNNDTAKAKDKAHAGHAMPKSPRAMFWAPGLAEITTRSLDSNDHFCGNEVVAYAPLSKGVDVLPAYTLTNSYQGKGLNTTWKAPYARSSFVGHFAAQ